MKLSTLFLAEQSAFLRRRTREWRQHIQRVRGFIGESLERAPRDRPVLILGAGSGLEIPWDLAPPRTTGWDLDPTSRLRTCLRWRRWPDWVFEDFTGGLDELQTLVRRSIHKPGSDRLRDTGLAARRLAGLIPSIDPDPRILRQWLERKRPSLVVGANWMGQLGVVAQRLVEKEFRHGSPWVGDPEAPDALSEALDQWVRRTIQSHVQVLRECGAELCMVYDRAVIYGDTPVQLGPFQADWTRQLQAPGCLTLSDPLMGLAAEHLLQEPARWERWLWSLSPGQCHLMEAAAWTPVSH